MLDDKLAERKLDTTPTVKPMMAESCTSPLHSGETDTRIRVISAQDMHRKEKMIYDKA
ncbi:MAG: uncharacterized DUF497 family protein [Zhongshania aliphaticivorans]|jgi:uncharacterized DUF497 family protein